MSGAAGETAERARALALVLGMQPGTFAGREQEAALIMALLAIMPTIRDDRKRWAYGNQILKSANQLLPFDQPNNKAFFGQVQSLVADMQTARHWFNKLTMSNGELIREYKPTGTAVKVLKGAGMGGAGSVGGSALKTGLKELQTVRNQPVPAGQKAPGSRGQAGAFGRGAVTGTRNSFTGGLAGRLQVFWVIGSLTYVGAVEHEKELMDEITRRFQERKLSVSEYRSSFGSAVALPQQFSPQR